MSGRWKAISPSQFPWEQGALDFVQRTLPNREPFRAYSNFEFVADDGSINEVDLLIISRYSIFLVEIKSRPGEVGGDSHTWIWRDGTREYFDDRPTRWIRQQDSFCFVCRQTPSMERRWM